MKIVLNGREYDGVEQMPPEVRQQYLEVMKALGDTDGNGLPEAPDKPGAPNVEVTESIIYNGREYKSRADLPADVREALEHMPPPKPEDIETRVEVHTHVERPKVQSDIWTASDRPAGGSERAFPWLLVLMLCGIILALLLLWLSGARPADLFKR